MADEHGM